jgi:hypothetical protein
VYLTLNVNIDAPRDRVLADLRDLIEGLHPPAERRPRDGGVRATRDKYDDDDVAEMIIWYYRLASGVRMKQLATETGGRTARHVAARQTLIARRLRWFRRALGLA